MLYEVIQNNLASFSSSQAQAWSTIFTQIWERLERIEKQCQLQETRAEWEQRFLARLEAVEQQPLLPSSPSVDDARVAELNAKLEKLTNEVKNMALAIEGSHTVEQEDINHEDDTATVKKEEQEMRKSLIKTNNAETIHVAHSRHSAIQ